MRGWRGGISYGRGEGVPPVKAIPVRVVVFVVPHGDCASLGKQLIGSQVSLFFNQGQVLLRLVHRQEVVTAYVADVGASGATGQRRTEQEAGVGYDNEAPEEYQFA